MSSHAAQPSDLPVLSLLLNWHATPYHAPLFLAQSKGFFAKEGIKVAICEPSDPSDCAELVAGGAFNLGVKAMIHTIAAKGKGLPITSIGTLMDEPFTGLCYIKGSGVTSDFRSLKGKRIGYVGFFGALQVNEIARNYGMSEKDYELVRVGMDVSGALIDGRIDAGVGLENVQLPEIEAHLATLGRPRSDAQLIRIDQLAGIQLIANSDWLAREPILAAMRAVHLAAVFLKENPVQAWDEYKAYKKTMRSDLNATIYERSFVYMSKTLHNVARDWNKVTAYCQRLGVCSADFQPNYTNEFIKWSAEPELVSPAANQLLVAEEQERVKREGGCLSCKVGA